MRRGDPGGSGDYLKGKKLLIYCFTAIELTEGGNWPKVPIRPAQP